MAEMSLKEILLSEKYELLRGYNFTRDYVLDFYVLYHEFSLLEEKYRQMVHGRKVEAANLVAKLKFLEEMVEIIATKLKTKKGYYQESTYDLGDASIKDFNKLYEVLKTLASTETTQYDIKTFEFSAYDSSEHHGYRTMNRYDGVIAILAEKESLSNLEASIKGTDISRERIMELYQQGYSMVLTGNDDFMTDYDLPSRYNLGSYHPIVFYLKDDELAKAATAFLDFAAENGTDMDNIEVVDLAETIKSKYQKKMNFKRVDGTEGSNKES